MTERDQDQELSALTDAIADGEFTMLDEPVELPSAATEEPKVVRSLRLSVDVDKRARAAAAERGVTVTAFLRDLIEAGLGGLETTHRSPAPTLYAHCSACTRCLPRPDQTQSQGPSTTKIPAALDPPTAYR